MTSLPLLLSVSSFSLFSLFLTCSLEILFLAVTPSLGFVLDGSLDESTPRVS